MTEQKFKLKLRLRLYVSLALAVAGAVAMFAAPNGYATLSCGILAGALAVAVKNLRTLRNKKLFKRSHIAETDERNVLIFRKAYSASWLITLLSLCAAIYIAPPEATAALSAVLGTTLASYAAAYYVYQKTT